MSITSDTKAAYAYARRATARAQEYCWTRQLFSVVAEQCPCETEQKMWRPEDEEHADAWWTTGGSEGCWTKSPRWGREQVRIVVPLEVPRDTRICNEDLVDMEIEQPRATTAEQELENASIQTLVTMKEAKEQRTIRWKKSTESGGSPQ